MSTPTTPGEQQIQRQALRSHVGIAETAKLTAWAEMVHRAWPSSTVWVYGSAITRKDFRDVDVVVLLPTMAEYRQVFPTDDQQLGSAWDVIAAGLSALAREMTGLPVEARITVSEGFTWDLTGRNSYILAGGTR